MCEAEPLLVNPATIEVSEFRLAELPSPVLSLVLFWLPMRQAAEAACVSKRFAAAFRDNVTWKRRCVLQLNWMDVEAAFAKTKDNLGNSWMHFFKKHTVLEVHIVTIGKRSDETVVVERFTVYPSPQSSVSDLFLMVTNHARNRAVPDSPVKHSKVDALRLKIDKRAGKRFSFLPLTNGAVSNSAPRIGPALTNRREHCDSKKQLLNRLKSHDPLSEIAREAARVASEADHARARQLGAVDFHKEPDSIPFPVKDLERTISDAKLYDGVVLQQPEHHLGRMDPFDVN